MISLNHYREFGDEKAPSVKDFFNDAPYYGKEVIINYMENGKVVVATTSYGIDCVTSEKVGIRKEILTDGEYTWSNMLIYYVKKYNMLLPSEFMEKVISLYEGAQ